MSLNPNATASAIASTPTGAIQPGLHVLLVDDDTFVHALMRDMLNRLGVNRVSVAADGDCGIAALGEGRCNPDVIICDIHMPGKDGFQVMEMLAQRGYKGSVILLSGMDERTLNSAALMGRFHHLNLLGVVAKPVSRAALAEMLSRAKRS